MSTDDRSPRACVFAPSPLLTVTVERAGDDSERAELHLHPGGQGYWIARMLHVLGVDVVVCTSFGGETGRVVRALMGYEEITIREVEAAGANGAYVHDRRCGQRRTIATLESSPLSRHEVDELYGATLVEALDADVCVLGGPTGEGVPSADIYRRLATDIGANGGCVVADLSGAAGAAVIDAGVWLYKVSHDELLADGLVKDTTPGRLVAAMEAIAERGAQNVVVSRAEDPAFALLDGEVLTVRAPRLDPVDHRGAGDSLTAGIAAGRARGWDLRESVRLGSAAGAVNVTRRGLATGHRIEIERMAERVVLAPLETSGV